MMTSMFFLALSLERLERMKICHGKERMKKY